MPFRNRNLAAKIALAKATSADMSQIKACDGDFQPPIAGPTPARLVEYIEMGKQEGEWQGKTKVNDKVELVFELIGKKHPPRQDADGKLHPVLVTVRENKSQAEKANWRKLFAQMNKAKGGTATHMAEFLGEAFLVTVFHEPSKDGKRVYANLKDENGYKMERPAREDMDTGEMIPVNVGPALTEPRAFFWDHADLDDWNALYIPGEYEERKDEKTGEVTAPARSKNRRQETMLKATNWNECPISSLLPQ